MDDFFPNDNSFVRLPYVRNQNLGQSPSVSGLLVKEANSKKNLETVYQKTTLPM